MPLLVDPITQRIGSPRAAFACPASCAPSSIIVLRPVGLGLDAAVLDGLPGVALSATRRHHASIWERFIGVWRGGGAANVTPCPAGGSTLRSTPELTLSAEESATGAQMGAVQMGRRGRPRCRPEMLLAVRATEHRRCRDAVRGPRHPSTGSRQGRRVDGALWGLVFRGVASRAGVYQNVRRVQPPDELLRRHGRGPARSQ
jgi:hypothetical protein